MRRLLFHIFPAIAVFISMFGASAQLLDSELRNHIIVAFDESGNKWRATDYKVRDGLRYYLFEKDGSGLLKADDFISFVGFKADCSGENWDNFAYVKLMPENNSNKFQSKHSMAFMRDSAYVRSLLVSPGNDWEKLANYSGPFIDASYSLLSIAKPYILSKIGAQNEKSLVNNTYILLVTDHQFNGGDFHNELQYFLSRGTHRLQGRDLNKVLELCYKVGEEYTFKYVGSKVWGTKPHLRYVELFEVRPNQSFLTLPAVINYAPSLQAARVKGNKHSFELNFKKTNNHFDVKGLNVFLKNPETGNEIFLERIQDLDSLVTRQYTINDSEEMADSLGVSYLRLEAELLLNDGFYGCTLLNKQMIPGLEQTIKVEYEKAAEIIPGIVMPDWMWRIVGVEDQAAAAVICFVILIVIALGLLVAYVLLTRTYKPSKKEVKIVFYD